MDDKQALNALGLCRRAGRCIAGDFAAERALRAGRACLVVLDTIASPATRERYNALCARYGVPYMELNGVGGAIGKPNGKIAVVTDGGFAGMIARASQKL